MKRLLTTFWLTAGFLWCGTAATQQIPIGEKMPDLAFTNVRNHPTGTLKLSDYRGKLLVLDFWNLRCTACFASFAKLDSLQKKFADRLQFILVNRESRTATDSFFAKRKKIRPPAVPMITGDTLLLAIFPHNFVPWYVWIDAEGTVRHISTAGNITEENIADFLNGQKLHMKDLEYVAEFDYSKPLIAEGNGRWLPRIDYYSYLMHYTPGPSAGNRYEKVGGSKIPNRISRTYASIASLYATAFGERKKYDFSAANTLILEVKNPTKYTEPLNYREREIWGEQHCYNYDLLLPPSRAANLFRVMQQDLERYFGVTGTIEKRIITCLVLERIGKKDKLKTKGGIPKTNFYKPTEDSTRYLYNMPFEQLTKNLAERMRLLRLPIPFVNATGYTGKIDIELSALNWKTGNIEGIRKDLQRYGLDLIEKEYPREVLVLRDKEDQL